MSGADVESYLLSECCALKYSKDKIRKKVSSEMIAMNSVLPSRCLILGVNKWSNSCSTTNRIVRIMIESWEPLPEHV